MGDTPTILIADDDSDVHVIFGIAFERAGYRVIGARNGPETLERARAHDPHVILLDVALPAIDGLTVATELRADPSFADMIIVGFSGMAITPSTAREAGCDAFFLKPVAPLDLVARVEAMRARHAGTR